MFVLASYTTYYTFDIQTINNLVYNYESYNVFIFGFQINFLEFLAIMLIGAAFIKSAQIGGHAWLPDSMEAPVPASSLIHSATLVSAGVYLILRFNFIFDATQFSRLIIPVIGSLTAAYGGVCAVAQSDVKKTLAYSTISHCGFLMVLCATEMNEFTILYLYVHGFFKAGVFMCVGNLLRITRGYQDNRRMGGLLKFLPFEYYCLVIGVFNLAGLPFTFGFFIKHLLLLSLNNHIYIYYFVVSNCLVGAFSGLFYSYRLSYYTFVDFKKGNKNLYLTLNNSSFSSNFYTNSSLAATASIFFLFVTSYFLIFFLFKCFLASNYLFSDLMNTTLLSNYYSIVNTPFGYLLNFSYINVTVSIILLYFGFSTFRKIQNNHTIQGNLLNILLLLLLVFLFYSIL
jgi:NADH:ubiquinone oxidoreductase subunit 5 (subunit L)/multisubunit Na+/H+ antiporter MnhA subunit